MKIILALLHRKYVVGAPSTSTMVGNNERYNNKFWKRKMIQKNQCINILNYNELKNYKTFHLVNCIVDTIDLIGVFEVKTHLVIENCIIDNFLIHSCWFENGLILKNSIIKNYVDYQMGGHNANPIVFERNIFIEFFNFFDCQFENIIELRNNIFRKGANLLGNRGEGFENSFVSGWIDENNIGDIDIDEV
jgi:hypothetical protein